MTDRLHVAFLTYPAFGHTIPVLPVVEEMVRRGHRVTCFTSEAFRDPVEATGARAVLYQAELETRPAKDSFTLDEVSWLMADMLENTMAVAPGIDAEFAKDWPDVVAYDTTLWAPGRFTTWRARENTVQLTAIFAANEHFSLAVDGMKVAGEKGSDLGQVDLEHPGMVAWGKMLDEHAATYGLRPEDGEALVRGDNQFTVVFVPREFQPAGDTFGDDHVFVGPCLSELPAEQGWQPPTNGRPVLLVTLGTTVNRGPEFFKEAMDAFAELPWHVVMTLGNRVEPEELGAPPDNVEVHKWIPHGEVLRHASLMVCQGGMGSVLESLYFGVPLIVVPHHSEQKLNAHRLEELVLAKAIAPEDVTGPALREAVQELLDDPETALRVARMRDHVRNAGGVKAAADALESRAKGER